MKAMTFKTLPILTITTVSVSLSSQVTANPVNKQTLHNEVFGQNAPASRPAAAPPAPALPALIPGKQRAAALQLYHQAADGSAGAADSLKSSANEGNRWAAVQYGVLAYTGRLPGAAGRPDYAVAARAWRLAARQIDATGREIGISGNYLAAYNMGLLYYYGQGVPANGSEALRWFRASITAYGKPNRTFYPAAIYAAQILERGYGVAKDEKAAVKMWLAAAREHEASAMLGYAKMTYAGKGTVRNPHGAYSMLTRAAERWNVDAMILLARIQANGDDFRDPNRLDAAKWLMIAAAFDKKKYGKNAERMLATLSERQRRQVKSSVASWLSSHATVPDEFDPRVPLNDDPPARR